MNVTPNTYSAILRYCSLLSLSTVHPLSGDIEVDNAEYEGQRLVPRKGLDGCTEVATEWRLSFPPNACNSGGQPVGRPAPA